MSELNAALGVLSLRMIDELLARRTRIIGTYRSELGDLVTWQQVAPSDISTYKDLSLGLGSSRAGVESALERAGVQTKRYFVPLHTMDPYAGFSHSPKAVSSAIYESSLCVPLYADLEPEDVDLIVKTIKETISVK
jgi:dTDP-4-amino-4,6-dideoxygalactose transaminase